MGFGGEVLDLEGDLFIEDALNNLAIA